MALRLGKRVMSDVDWKENQLRYDDSKVLLAFLGISRLHDHYLSLLHINFKEFPSCVIKPKVPAPTPVRCMRCY